MANIVLNYEKRKILEKELKRKTSVTKIAEILHTSRDTIYKELLRNNMTKESYDARKAQLGVGSKNDGE